MSLRWIFSHVVASELNKPHKKKETIAERKCVVCGKVYRAKSQFCSAECYKKHKEKRKSK